MRKIFILFLILMSVVLVYGNAEAISGVCSNCHTMHNSQDGASVTGGAPNEQLLNAGCVACHTGTTGQTSTFGAPAVLHTTAPAGQGAGRTVPARPVTRRNRRAAHLRGLDHQRGIGALRQRHGDRRTQVPRGSSISPSEDRGAHAQ